MGYFQKARAAAISHLSAKFAAVQVGAWPPC